MRVKCETLDDFIENLTGGESVHGGMVRASVSEVPQDGPKRGRFAATKWTILFQVTAVMVAEDGGEYILVCGIDCGTDYRDADEELAGSARAVELRKRLEDCCEKNGLTVRPGVIDY